jgi:hypothetical protein
MWATIIHMTYATAHSGPPSSTHSDSLRDAAGGGE